MADSEDVVGVVLAGGDSRRMGRDKALLKLDGRTLLATGISLLAEVCSRVVVADRLRHLETGAESVADGDGHGPAAGILGAARAQPDTPLLVLACDLPRVTTTLLHRLAREDRFDWYLPRHASGIEPLCALFRPPALRALEGQVRSGEMSLQALLGARLLGAPLKIGFLEGAELDSHGRPRDLFFNVNRPVDARRLDPRGSA